LRPTGTLRRRGGVQVQPAGRQVAVGLRVCHVQADQFGQPQARRVEQFQHGVIAQALQRIVVRRFHQRVRIVGRERLGQRLAAFGRAYAADRIGADFAMQAQPAVERTPHREPVRDRAGRQILAMGAHHAAANVAGCEGAQVARAGELLQLVEFMRIPAQGVFGQLALVRKAVEKTGDCGRGAHRWRFSGPADG
jgi:hypothetical protein